MRIERKGRVITIEVEDSDLRPGVDEDIQLDALFTGMRYATGHLDEVTSYVQANMPGFDAFAEALRDFRERWEL